MAGEKFKGVPLFLNGQTYLVPSLSFVQFQKHYKLLIAPMEGFTEDSPTGPMEAYVGLVGDAIRRNYPDVSDGDLREWLDLNTFREALLAVQGASGLKVVAPGE